MKRSAAYITAALVAMILVAALWPNAEAADPPPSLRLAQANQVVVEEPEYSGVFACLGCHSAGDQSPYGDSLARVRLDEVLVWHQHDKHSLAYCVLSGELSKRMSARLGYNAAESKACLACHAPRHDQRSADASTPPNYKLSEGVTCEDCHGGSRGWHRLHILKDQWRELSAAEKQSHGMNDLRDPLTRANVCLDCHLGNAENGQIVTHEMFAAGHPPLASVDVVAYADDMPRHWRNDRERAERGAPRTDADALLNTRLALTGYLLSGERALRLAARDYDGLPDFAAFDCDACHHELTSPSWRQARFKQGMPGRPGYRAWSIGIAATVSTILGDEETNATVRRTIDELQSTLQTRAFGGDWESTSAAPLALADIWKAQAKEISAGRLERPQVEGLVTKVLEQSLDSTHPPDYDTARALAWLLRTALDDLGIAASDSSQAAWQALEDQLGLAIPPRSDAALQRQSVELTCAVDSPEPIAALLTETLRRRAEYDPGRFQQSLSAYGQALLGEDVVNGLTAEALSR